MLAAILANCLPNRGPLPAPRKAGALHLSDVFDVAVLSLSLHTFVASTEGCSGSPLAAKLLYRLPPSCPLESACLTLPTSR